MQEADLHDLSDDADYAASQLQAVSTSRSESMRRSSSGDPDGAALVYLKDNVAIHPTQFASERISGRLKLVKQAATLFMTWIPYRGENSNAWLSEKDRNLYTIKGVSFKEVKSVRRHTPTLSWQYIIVVLSSGLAYPPMYFYNGGVKEFLATLKLHVFLVRSAEDANVFLINDFQDPLQRTLSSLELPRYVSSSREGAAHERDLSIHVLEKFSLVTRFAREATSQLFHESAAAAADNSYGNWKGTPSSSHSTTPVGPDVPETVAVSPDPLEVDKLLLVWGKPRQVPLGSAEWETMVDSEGRVVDSKALRMRVFYGGMEESVRKEVWPFLLGYHPYDSTYAEREYLISVRRSEYETIKRQWQSISGEQARRFTKFRERKGLVEKDVVRTDRSVPFYDGDDNPHVDILHDVLLTYSFYDFDLGYCQGMSDLASPLLYVMRDEADSFWCFAHLMERLGPNFNRDQAGMHTQLFALSKLVEILDPPLHNYLKRNDCLNYFFCFRWILIQFKREFEYERTMKLWEVLWTQYLTEHMHLYVCVAVLKRYRGKIMGEQMDFDTILKFINGLSGCIDLDAVLRDAEALLACAGERGEACIPPGTPPSLPLLHHHHPPVLSDDDHPL